MYVVLPDRVWRQRSGRLYLDKRITYYYNGQLLNGFFQFVRCRPVVGSLIGPRRLWTLLILRSFIFFYFHFYFLLFPFRLFPATVLLLFPVSSHVSHPASPTKLAKLGTSSTLILDYKRRNENNKMEFIRVSAFAVWPRSYTYLSEPYVHIQLFSSSFS